MSVECILPFGLAANGSIATTTNPNLQVTQHLQALVSTNPGERVMMPTYGVPLANDLFGAYLTSEIDPTLQIQVQAAVATWEPNVNVAGISVGPPAGTGQDGGVINIDWTPTAIQSSAASGTVNATIMVGGAVVENGTTR
jgi:phage baseplate assembly protein W